MAPCSASGDEDKGSELSDQGSPSWPSKFLQITTNPTCDFSRRVFRPQTETCSADGLARVLPLGMMTLNPGTGLLVLQEKGGRP